MCRQVGADLHKLSPALPLFDGVTGQKVLQLTDSRVERLRDVLMDDARERVDNLGEDLVAGTVSLATLRLAFWPPQWLPSQTWLGGLRDRWGGGIT